MEEDNEIFMTNFDVCFVSSEEAMVASKEFITSVVVGKYSQWLLLSTHNSCW